MKRKAMRWTWLLVLPTGLLLWLYLALPLRLLDQADIPRTQVRGILGCETWTDWLNYTDGYDWAILRVGDDFSPPESWTQGAATLREINPTASGHYFHTGFINHPALPESFTAWLYIPHDDAAPFEQRTWFAAMYDADSDVLALYLGHDLWGF